MALLPVLFFLVFLHLVRDSPDAGFDTRLVALSAARALGEGIATVLAGRIRRGRMVLAYGS